MVRWLAFLFWLFSFSTWKAFFVRVFMKPPSRDHLADRVVDELESSGVTSNGGESNSSSVSLYQELSDSLAALPSKISSKESVCIRFSEVNGPLTAGDDEFVKESMKAIATSTVLKTLALFDIWPCTMEGIAEALLSNQSVKRLEIHYEGNEVLELVSRVLLENKCLERVRISRNRVCNRGAANVSDALRRNRTLKGLELGVCEMNEEGWKLLLEPLSGGDDSNTVLEHLEFNCFSGAKSHCGVHIGNMVRRNTSLHTIGIWFPNDDVATSVVCSIGEALSFNTQLSRLMLKCLGGRNDVLKGLWSSLIPNSQGQQANSTLKSLDLYFPSFASKIDSLANMLQNNTSLVELWGIQLPEEEAVIKLLEALKTNKCLEILDLCGCKGVKGGRVLGTIMDLLLENHHLKEILLSGTPLNQDGSAQIIKAVLEKKKNDRLLEIVQGMATTTPTSARVFLCGEPYAGKTTLRKTIMDIHSKSITKISRKEKKKTRWGRKPRINEDLPSAKSSEEERTRGIEVHNLSYDNIHMTIWDMAGQEEYHAFHDLIVPNLSGGGSCCSFILVCNTQSDFKTNIKKGLKEVIVELTYWFKFIASNTRISALYCPHVKIVFTHVDLWSANDIFYRDSIEEKVKHLKLQFQDLLKFQEHDYFINAKCKDSAQLVLKDVGDHLQGLLRRVPKIVQACIELQQVVAKWIVQNPNKLLLEWEAFSSICDGIQDLKVLDDSQSELARRRKEYVAASLHDSGHLIFHVDLKIIIMNPHLFCHNIMGELITRCMNKESMSRPKWISRGCITKDHLRKVLLSLPTDEQHKVSFDDVVKIMLKLELCYEQEDGKIMIPSTLEEGSENMSWKCGGCNYIGRRLIYSDSRTQLSPGFFPRLQVSFQKKFEDEKTYKIMKGLITFIYKGMEIIIEYSGSLGFGIDIMISSNEDEEIILNFLHERLIKHIFNLCGQPTLGCPGVRLVECIIRPACVRELVPCKFRVHQAVSVENLKQTVLAHADLSFKYTWIEEGQLPSGYDDARTLLGNKMWDDVLNRFMDDLKEIEHRISKAQPSMDSDDTISSFNVLKATKPRNATCDDVWDLVNAFGYKLYVTQNENKDEVLERLNKLEIMLSKKMEDIHSIQKRLMLQVRERLEELLTFIVEFQQHKYPRLAYFKQCDKRKGTSLAPGMKHFVLHLMCEHKDGFHIVEDQEGCQVSFGNDSTKKFMKITSWMLRVITLIVKVGAHVGAGMGSMIPDLEKVFFLIADTPGLLDGMDFATTKTRFGNVDQLTSSHDEEVAQQCLIDLLREKCKSIDNDIKGMFKLQKVKYNGNGDGAGSVAWICNKHFQEGKSRGGENGSLELLPSGIDS